LWVYILIILLFFLAETDIIKTKWLIPIPKIVHWFRFWLRDFTVCRNWNYENTRKRSYGL